MIPIVQIIILYVVIQILQTCRNTNVTDIKAHFRIVRTISVPYFLISPCSPKSVATRYRSCVTLADQTDHGPLNFSSYINYSHAAQQ